MIVIQRMIAGIGVEEVIVEDVDVIS